MWPSIVLGFFAGVFFGNGIPHFVKGITRDCYPCVFGGGPVPNLIAGWISLIVAGSLTRWIDMPEWGMQAAMSAAVGLLAIGVFYAGPVAFGRP